MNHQISDPCKLSTLLQPMSSDSWTRAVGQWSCACSSPARSPLIECVIALWIVGVLDAGLSGADRSGLNSDTSWALYCKNRLSSVHELLLHTLRWLSRAARSLTGAVPRAARLIRKFQLSVTNKTLIYLNISLNESYDVNTVTWLCFWYCHRNSELRVHSVSSLLFINETRCLKKTFNVKMSYF